MIFRKNYVFTGLALFLFISWAVGLFLRYRSGEPISVVYLIVAASAGVLFFRLAFVPFAELKERIVVLNPGLFVSRIVAYDDIKSITRQSDTNVVIEIRNGDPIVLKEMFLNKADRAEFAKQIMQRIS